MYSKVSTRATLFFKKKLNRLLKHFPNKSTVEVCVDIQYRPVYVSVY